MPDKYTLATPASGFRVLTGFDQVDSAIWNAMLRQGPTNELFLTWEWQQCWWEVFGRGKLLLVVAEQAGIPVAIAPLFLDEGMVFFVGSGGSDYLDFIGSPDYDVLAGMLGAAVQQAPDFLGFLFYHVPEASSTSAYLHQIARTQGWKLYQEGSQVAPALDIVHYPEVAVQAPQKKSLRRHQNWFARNGQLRTEHFRSGHEATPFLDTFFTQHIKRWSDTPYPSLFLDQRQCQFYRLFSQTLANTGWFRFTRVVWNEQTIASHVGFCYAGSFLWYKPTFDPGLARHSPGEVLLRELLMLALEEQATVFDFGLGDEAFKRRFSTTIRTVYNWGLYPA
ncbi:MAG: GNAT family N-acetyltransferase [Bacteroidetes bacterium]|nr:GNAT family N-acetyltransferase [Bacteroidota bacterium]